MVIIFSVNMDAGCTVSTSAAVQGGFGRTSGVVEEEQYAALLDYVTTESLPSRLPADDSLYKYVIRRKHYTIPFEVCRKGGVSVMDSTCSYWTEEQKKKVTRILGGLIVTDELLNNRQSHIRLTETPISANGIVGNTRLVLSRKEAEFVLSKKIEESNFTKQSDLEIGLRALYSGIESQLVSSERIFFYRREILLSSQR